MIKNFHFEEKNSASLSSPLIVQFLLSDLLNAYHTLTRGSLSTSEGMYTSSPLIRCRHHSLQLLALLPRRKKDTKRLHLAIEEAIYSLSTSLSRPPLKNALLKKLQNIYVCLEPFLIAHKDNENLFMFLLKQRETIDLLMQTSYLHPFLLSLYPEGLEAVGEKMCDRYHQRGFFSQITECKLLLTQLLHEKTPTLSHC